MSITSLQGIHDPIATTQRSEVGLRGLREHLELFEVGLDPDYQREHVWTQDQQGSLLGHLLEGGALPDIIFNEIVALDFQGHVDRIEVVDGKQRITAMVKWLEGEIPGRLSDGREVWYADLDRISRTIISTEVRLTFKHVRLDRMGVLKLYLKLNRGGTVHTAAEIARVRAMLLEEHRKGEPSDEKTRREKAC